MIDEKYAELMHRAIDGLASPEERRKLEEYLASDAEAARYYRDLRSTVEMLDTADEIEPPPGASERILADVFGEEKDRGRRTERAGNAIIGSLGFLFRRRYAYAFAAGLLIGAVIMVVAFDAMQEDGFLNRDDLRGTLGLGKDAEFDTITGLELFSSQTISGSIRSGIAAERIFTELKVSSPSMISIVFEYPSDSRLIGIVSSDGDRYRLDVSETGGELVHEGVATYILTFSRDPSAPTSITMKIVEDGTVSFTKNLFVKR